MSFVRSSLGALAARIRRRSALPLPPLIFLVIALFLGFWLRIYHLDAKDMWVDEAHPWWFASLPILESIRLGLSGGAINSGADPLYNILLHYWIRLTGSTLFGLRYLSVILNFLGVAYLGRVAARAFDWRVGRVALLVGAAAPVWVYFSQEMRPYTFTPLLMLLMVEPVLRIQPTRGLRWWPWVALAAAEALSIYAHGFMILGVFAVNLWIGVCWLRDFRRPSSWLWLRNWVISQVAVMLVLSPVIPLLLARTGGIRNPFTVALTAPQFANLLWAYFMGIPWENVFDPIPLRLWVALLLIVLGGLLAFALRGKGRRSLADLFWLVYGLSFLSMLYDWRDPSFHPRYVIYITGPLFLFLGAAAVRAWERHRAGRWMAGLFAGLYAVIAFTSITALYDGAYRGYRHPATLDVSNTLKREFGPQDAVVVVAPHDFTLDYYGHGPAPLAFSRFDEGVETPQQLLDFVRGKATIGVLRNNNEHSDSRRILPFYLERYGALVSHAYFEGYDLATYRLDPGAQPRLADFTPLHLSWGVLDVTGLSMFSGDAVTVALKWQTGPDFQPGMRYKTSIRLVDPLTHWELASADTLLYSPAGAPTDWWQPGQQTEEYVVLPLEPGTPPIDAQVILSLYDSATGRAFDLRDERGAPAGQQADLGSITLGPAPAAWAYEEDQRPWHLLHVTSQLLSGYLFDQAEVAPGGALGLTLSWSISPEELASHHAVIRVVQNGVVIASDDGLPLQGRPPAASVPWLDRRYLAISREAQPGSAEVLVVYDGGSINLGRIQVSSVAHIMTRPTIKNPLDFAFANGVKLVGYDLDLPQPLTSQQPLPLTLYWQALADGAPDANYKVFAQILAADGHLVGQHDGVPADETRPFSGWLSGEFVIDPHTMVFRASYEGIIHIQVGLYDPNTLRRVLTLDGRDSVLLPLELQVESK